MDTRFESSPATEEYKTKPIGTALCLRGSRGPLTSYFFVILSVILFIAGFLAGEDAFGGKIRADLYVFHEPTMWAFRNRPFLAVLQNYNSATTPLFHVLESFNPLLGHDAAFRATNALFSLFICWLLVYAMRHRFEPIPTARNPALLIGASILLSPYFRAESYWASTDLLPVFLIIVTAVLLNPVQDGNSRCELTINPWVLTPLLALVSWSCFYCRQTDIFLPFYVFLIMLTRFRTYWWWVILAFGTFAAPAVYLIHIWRGLTPPGFRRHEGLSLDAIVQPLSMIFIYAVPFLLEILIKIKKTSSVIVRLRSTWLYLLAGLVGFVALFHRFHFYEGDRGGGIASKVLDHYGEPGRYLFLAISYFGFLIVLLLCRQASWKGRTLIVSFLLPAFTMTFFFQRYYDPLLLVLFFLLWERKSVSRFLTARMGYLLIGFNAILLVGALVYNGRTEPVFLPLASHPRPWTEVTPY